LFRESTLTSSLVHNDFHQTHALFELFDGLTVPGLSDPVLVDTDKSTNGSGTNGTNGVNGHHEPPEETPQA